MAGHVAAQHAHAHIKVDEIQLKQIAAQCRLGTEWPVLGHGPRSQILGLAVHQGYTCGHCKASFRAVRNMESHYHDHHLGITRPSTFAATSVQRLSKSGGPASSFFQIQQTRTPQQLQTAKIIQTLRDQITESANQMANTKIVNDERLLSPWLRTTRWHEYILNEDVDMLRSLVKAVKTPANQVLQAAVLALLQTGVSLIPRTRDLVLQYLNSPDPVKRYVLPSY